ncbi:MAG: chorismate mutase [Candidatus Odinarchaeota archaeon]
MQPSDKKDIKYQRGLIDRLTFKILELFKQRTDAAMNIAKIKAEKETSIRDIEREKQLLDEAALYAKRIGLPEEDAISLVKELIRLTVKLEEKTSKTGK